MIRTPLTQYLVCTLEVIKLQMAAELPAIVVYSILEIVGGISYEGENVEIRENWDTSFSMLCTPIPIDCGYIMPTFSEKAQTKMQICP